MARISASILGFYFEAKKKGVSESIMIDKINSELKRKDRDFDILHLDIEDGTFVSQRSYSSAMIRKVKCAKKREAHLMVIDYNTYIKEFFDLADMFIIHNEAIKGDFEKTVSFIKKNKKFIGISINPETPVSDIKHLDKVDEILVMGVHPGLPGQKFIEHSLLKIKKLHELKKSNGYKYSIAVDGGIDHDIAKKCEAAGADILVMGSHFFK